jgi:hypothetical protein
LLEDLAKQLLEAEVIEGEALREQLKQVQLPADGHTLKEAELTTV